MSASLLHEYFERISHLLRSETRRAGADYGLQPIQLDALNYLNRSNRYSDTPLGVTEYLGLTKGTVSQTLMVLERKGLTQKTPDKKDGRIVHLNVTKTGKKLLDKILPTQTVRSTWEGVSTSKQNQWIKELQQILKTMQRLNGMKPFGVCRTCRYNRDKGNGKFFCELTQENLSRGDTGLICREYLHPEKVGR
ncbi:Transcriptional regulator, MarR family [hydrothermal vent metagenome]|uniref:Transcriptional regulator, MarR family n=1 Tax=hydrothermal vent metagenome TaxID=652676 RepID=A0A3B1CL72_9ZZZZ